MEELKKYINSKQSVISQVIALRFEKDEGTVAMEKEHRTESFDSITELKANFKKEGKLEEENLSPARRLLSVSLDTPSSDGNEKGNTNAPKAISTMSGK